ncbi:ABC-2 type transport system permease protein [Methylomarinovum tepidoasis]|uniref:Transport permease protein n=1 Tax=Methylomarinovum tepidoasis TaxID=2840183 RepID=A0AAU9C783_9GAMM|nr:ABC transporter permease [Methylomarinovum sp. IN45]BCX87662.1 ABC-2 type transport system permease protein [Methylomarinovum sp. IN45]
MLQRIWHLIVKEFLTLLKDKRSRFVVIVPPLVQLVVFGYAATFDLNHIPYAVYNEDKGERSQQVLARLRGSPVFEEVARIDHDAQIAPLIDRREALFVIHFGPRFSERFARGQSPPLQVVIDGRNSNTALITLGYLRTILADFTLERLDLNPPARLVTRAWFNEDLQSRWFIVPGIVALLTLVVAMVTTALTVAREREQGTFDQLLVTPLTPFEILIGKTVPPFVIGLFEGSLILAAAVYWFEVPFRGALWLLYAGLAVYLLAAIGVGLMISSLAVTQQQGLMGAFLFIVPAVILSGFATPIENMPEVVQRITLLDPMRYFLVIVRTTFLADPAFALLWPQFWPMAVIGVVTLALAAWLFRHRLY